MQPYVTFKCKYIDEDAGLAQLGGFLYKHSWNGLSYILAGADTTQGVNYHTATALLIIDWGNARHSWWTPNTSLCISKWL